MIRALLHIALIAGCCGCATIFNGTTQDVPVLVPDGTVIRDTNGILLPIISGHREYPKFITLKRKRDYILTFDYKGARAVVEMTRTMNGWWLIPDILCYVVPTFVDMHTGAWHSFDGVQVAFPDSAQTGDFAVSRYPLMIDQVTVRKKLGITALFGLGIAGPVGGDQAYLFLLGNSFTYGLGYRLRDDTHLFGEVNTSYVLDVHPRDSPFSSEPTVTCYEAGVRYYPVASIYLGAAAGLAQVEIDSIKSHIPGGRVDRVMPGNSSNVGTFSFGIGHAGSVGFIELRYRIGLHGFNLNSGERGKLNSFLFRYGFNIEF
jgi:hypothetical protein